MTALEEEVRHLNCTIRAHKEEACQLSEKVSDIEHLREQKEKEQQQLQEQLRIKEQQVKRNSLLSSSPLLTSCEIYGSVELWPGSRETGSQNWSVTRRGDRLRASQPTEAEQLWARPNAQQAERPRARGHKAQGRFKSEVHNGAEVDSFVCSLVCRLRHNPTEKPSTAIIQWGT